MNYCKVIKDGEIIDATCSFLCWQAKHDIFLSCDIEDAQFIQSSDGTTIWRVSWLNRLADEFSDSRHANVETVEAVEIEKDEYLTLLEQLEEDGVITTASEETATDDEEDTEEETTEGTEEVMSVIEMRLRLKALEETVAELQNILSSEASDDQN